MTEVDYCHIKGCTYTKDGGCTRESVILDVDGCIHKEDRISMYDKGAGESSWHEGLK